MHHVRKVKREANTDEDGHFVKWQFRVILRNRRPRQPPPFLGLVVSNFLPQLMAPQTCPCGSFGGAVWVWRGYCRMAAPFRHQINVTTASATQQSRQRRSGANRVLL